MAYTKQTWENLPSQTTPINADRLTHIEDGIFNAAATADTAASDASSAISGLADKVDKVEGKGLSTNDFTDALKTKLDGIATGAEVNVQADYAQTNTEADDYIKNKPTLGTASAKNSISVVTDSSDLVESGAVENIIGWGNKNLLPNNATSRTINGVTFTVNNDGSISTSGTSTSDWIIFDIGNVTLKSGTYKFNGCNGGSVNTYRMILSKTGSDVTTLYDGENEFTLEEDTEVTAKIIVRYANVNMNDKVFYPMISVNGGAYEPFHASVEESLAEKTDNSVIGTVEDGTNPTKSYAIGEHMIRGGKFCTLTSPVTTSSTWTLNGNYVEGDVADLFDPVLGVATTNNSNITLDSQRNSLKKIGNVVEFRIRFTNSADISSDSSIVVLMQFPFGLPLNVRYIPIVDNDSQIIGAGFINSTTNNFYIYNLTLPAGTHDISGVYLV